MNILKTGFVFMYLFKFHITYFYNIPRMHFCIVTFDMFELYKTRVAGKCCSDICRICCPVARSLSGHILGLLLLLGLHIEEFKSNTRSLSGHLCKRCSELQCEHFLASMATNCDKCPNYNGKRLMSGVRSKSLIKILQVHGSLNDTYICRKLSSWCSLIFSFKKSTFSCILDKVNMMWPITWILDSDSATFLKLTSTTIFS